MNYVAHVPLIGGFALANMNVVGKPPVAITSYAAFEGHDKLLLRYLHKKDIEIPYWQIDKLQDKDVQLRAMREITGPVDFVSAVPPCAGLSNCSSLQKGARAVSPCNDWMYKSTEFVLGTLRPIVYVFENAPNLFTDAGEPVRNGLIEIAMYHGYAGTFYKTNSLLHGIPQHRPRTYTIMYKGKYAPILKYFDVPSPSVEEYLKQIPADATLQDAYATKEPFINDFEITQFVIKKFGENWRKAFHDVRDHLTSYDFLNRKGLLNEFRDFVVNRPDPNPASVKDIDHVIKKLSMGKNFRLSHRVLCVDKHHVYAVIGEMMERNVHPTEPRRMNIREYMHLMGLPHDFDLLDPREYGKLTQNVPVKTSEDITREVIEIINGNREFSNERFHLQNNMKIEAKRGKSLF